MKRLLSILCLAAMMAFSCGGGGDEPDTPVTPGAPKNLELHESTTTSLTFQWSLADGAVAYNWKLLKGGVQVNDGQVKSRNVVIEGLEPATAYTFKVRSVGENGSQSDETELEAETEGETPVDPPVNPPVDPPVDPVNPDEAYAMFMIPEWEDADGLARAFPGAEGGGMWTTGGRGGSVYHVTSLADTNTEGTLRYGVQTLSGPRIIVFDVAGIIELTSQLQVKKGDVYIAGQTAPGDGICLKNYTFRIQASNVIVRFIRCRMGDEKKTEDDAMQIMDHDDDKFTNIIIDHCTISWCTDECASFYGQKNFSFQWNIVSESLRNSIHEKGAHGYGGIWGGTNSTYHHNLLAHHDSRNPRLDHDYVSTQKGPLTLVNNVIYNWSGNTIYGGESANTTNTFRKYNIINNYFKPGPVTSKSKIWFLDPWTSCTNCAKTCSTIVPGHFYMTGNVMHGYADKSADNWSATTAKDEVISTIRANEPFVYDASRSYIGIQTAENAFNAVLDYAGASLKRDRIDTRIATETRNGTYTYTGSNGSTKGLIDTQGDVGEWPTYSAGDETIVDTDRDGMPDWFEDMFGLDKSSNADAKTITLDKKGRYTNLEMYLHYIVRNIIAGQNANANYTKL